MREAISMHSEAIRGDDSQGLTRHGTCKGGDPHALRANQRCSSRREGTQSQPEVLVTTRGDTRRIQRRQRCSAQRVRTQRCSAQRCRTGELGPHRCAGQHRRTGELGPHRCSGQRVLESAGRVAFHFMTVIRAWMVEVVHGGRKEASKGLERRERPTGRPVYGRWRPTWLL